MSRLETRQSGRQGTQTQTAVVIILGAAALLGGTGYVRMRSAEFVYGSPMLDRPIVVFVSVMAAAGVAYLTVVALTLHVRVSAVLLGVILGIGALMRLLLVDTTPILEDDYYRYLWDGDVSANGINPNSVVPADAPVSADATVTALARESGVVIERVNHPKLTTVYPPVAQAAFTSAYLIKPWSLNAWRLVLLGFEAATCVLLLLLLRAIGRPLHWVIIYWWNPLAVVMTVNAGHMDAVVLPFVIAAALCAIKNRPVAMCVAGALAIGAKLWPIVIAPVLMRNLRGRPAQLGIALIIGSAVVLAIGSPMYVTVDQGPDSGLAAYAGGWEMNDALFVLFVKAADGWLNDPAGAQTVARVAVGAAVCLVVGLLSLNRAGGWAASMNRVTIALGVLFMLIPAQFPWYYIWVLPFLTLSPRASLLSLSATLPLYYLKFWYAAQDSIAFFHSRVVWFEYAPCLVLAGIEALRSLLGKPEHA